MKNKLKRLLTFFLALLCITCATPSTAFGATVSNITFDICEVNGNKSASISDSSTYPGYKTCYIDNFTSSVNEIYLSPFDYENGYNYKLKKDDVIHFTMYTLANSRYVSFKPTVYFYCTDSSGKPFGIYGSGNYERSTGLISCNIKVPKDTTNMYLWYLDITDVKLNQSYDKFYFTYKSPSIQTESADSAYKNSVTNFFKELFEKFKSWFDTLFQWLKDIRDYLSDFSTSVTNSFSNLVTNMRLFFTQLGQKLSDGFSNLTNNISTFFSNLTNNLKTWFENIGDWFVDLGDNIAGFFEKLWNRIWWGNENGESEYQKPVINNKLTDILATLNDYQQKLKDTIDTIGSSADEISTYITTGTSFVNGVINVAGGGITALIVFGMVFILVRKVVGR